MNDLGQCRVECATEGCTSSTSAGQLDGWKGAFFNIYPFGPQEDPPMPDRLAWMEFCPSHWRVQPSGTTLTDLEGIDPS